MDICTLFSGARGSFSRSRLRGTQGTRLYTTTQVWVPAGLRGACSGRSKSRNLASDRGIAFRPATVEPTRPMQTPKMSFFSFFDLSAAVFEVLQQLSKDR